MKLILASQSPRRQELMGLMKVPFTVCVPHIQEVMDSNLTVSEAVGDLSRQKARAIEAGEDTVVVAADTVVVCDEKILGKPRDREDAIGMLSLLSGRSHLVMTGVTVCCGGEILTHTEVTEVTFRSLSRQEICRYVDTGEPMDKAGAYGIQGGGALFVEGIRGDYYNVMGLPVCQVLLMLRKIAPKLMEERP